jgi:ribosomal-protein-alanine N-acetyltransferase
MSEEIILRGYRANDLEAMFRLDEDCFTEEFRFDRRSMREFAEQRGAVVRVAEGPRGEIAGFVIVHLEEAVTGRRGYVVTLDVRPEYRRKGLAGRLMREAEAGALAAGVRSMQLHVFTGNAGAIRFYEGLGYARIGTRRGFYGAPGRDAFVYGRELKYV